MIKIKSLLNREGGYMEYGIIMILILVSITIISYLQLTQTNLRFSTNYQEQTHVANKLFSEGNKLQSETKKAIEDVFTQEAIFNNNAETNTHLSIDYSNTSLLPINSIENFENDIPRLDSYFDFYNFDYYSEWSEGELKTFTFIRESTNQDFILTGSESDNPLLPRFDKYALWGGEKLENLGSANPVSQYRLKTRPLEFVTVYLRKGDLVEVTKSTEQFVFIHKENILSDPLTNQFIAVVHETYYIGSETVDRIKGLQKVKRNL